MYLFFNSERGGVYLQETRFPMKERSGLPIIWTTETLESQAMSLSNLDFPGWE